MSSSSRGGDPKAHCQTLLMRFRVIELKELLRSIGQSSKGRKPDLVQRAADLLKHGSPKVQQKIVEIWERSHSSRKPDSYQKMAQRYAPMKGSSGQGHHHHRTTTSSPQFPYTGRYGGGQYVIHPDVTFKSQPFYVKTDTIIRPTALISTNVTHMGSYSMRLEFNLSPQQIHRVHNTRHMDEKFDFLADSSSPRKEYDSQVVIRFCRYETSCEQEDFLPKGCVVRINGQYLQMPSSAHNWSEQLRKSNPLNITQYIKSTAAQTNDITVIWQHDIVHPQGFVTTIELNDVLSYSDLLTTLKGRGVRNADYTRALVKEKLSIDKDSEISATSLKVSLTCPLGKSRITNPCRANSCKHLQCFDASIYLQMNERKARWVCPVCDKPAPFDDLLIDGLFKEICESSPSNDIEFSADGSWHPFSKKTGTTCTHLSTPERNASRYSPVMIRDTPDEVERDGVGGASGRGQAEPVVIDLTLSSDEEDDPLPRRISLRRQSSSSSTSSASSSDERDDVITNLNTSGHVSPTHSPAPGPILVNLSDTPPTPVGRGSSAVARGNNVSGHNNSDVGDSSSGLSQYPIFDPSQLPISFSLPTSYTSTGLSGSSGFQEIPTAPQSSSSNSGTSLLFPVSQPLSLSSSRSSGQPTPVISSNPLPVLPPYQQFSNVLSSSSESDFAFLFSDNDTL